MFKTKLNQTIDKKNSCLCVGLDSELKKIPEFLHKEKNPILKFNQEIIDATFNFAAAYKINIAFYESLGTAGWQIVEKTLKHIPSDTIVIADAKRGDIGNTSRLYAKTFFETFKFDAITVAPYMGYDSVEPFLEFENHGVFVLCVTSNPGSADFQYLKVQRKPLFLSVAQKVVQWNSYFNNCGLVVGATQFDKIKSVRKVAPEIPFLIPGIGVQGGKLKDAVKSGTDIHGKNMLINASRSIIYSSNKKDFASVSGNSAHQLREEINQYRTK